MKIEQDFLGLQYLYNIFMENLVREATLKENATSSVASPATTNPILNSLRDSIQSTTSSIKTTTNEVQHVQED